MGNMLNLIRRQAQLIWEMSALAFLLEGLLMKHWNYILVAAVAMMVVGVSQASAANLLANPGFEDPITTDGPPFVGSWEGFSGGPPASVANGSVEPLSGAMEVDLTLGNVNNFAGVFQDVPVAGLASVTFSGFHQAASSPLDLGTEIRIEWRDAVSEVGRTLNLTPVANDVYTPFSLTATAPANATTARVVYAIQSFSTAPLGNGTVYLDDFSVVVPEPASAVLLGLGLLSLFCVCRRM